MKIHLRVVEGPDLGRTFTFETRDRFILGRAPTANFQIANDLFFSRHHLMLEVNPPNVLLQDLMSMNGTFVNDHKVEAPTPLKDGDTIGGGKTRLRLELEEPRFAVPAPVSPVAAPAAVRAAAVPAQNRAPGARPADVGTKVSVRCLRCGVATPNELPRLRAENMAYFCDPCQAVLVAEPKLLPGYQVVRELGRGAMGAVYLAVHAVLGRRALKMILPRAAMSQRMRDLFVREAASQAILDHPRIVRVHDFQETARGIFCMVMEFVEGTSAESLLETNPAGLEPRRAASIVVQALEGLAHAHGKGIVHRDIKDANLLVGHDDQGQLAVKLSDFGLAKSYETSGASGFTRTGDVAGTIPYMAPEQITDFKNVRPFADLYSMGATLYHLLANQPAYDFRRETDPLITILEEEIVPLQRRKPTIPPAIAMVAEHAMRKDPSRRFASANEMRAALIAALQREPITA